ncbi:MAG: LysR family transcriptional regulator [Solirubrobacteraceae bacterium]
MLDVRRLRVLRAVAREGSLSGAARALDYTQPAVSHHIARLEEEVGTSLLRRTPRGMAVTDAGAALVAHADALLARLAAAEDEVAAIAQLRAGRVRLAAFPSGAATLVPAAARALRERHPQIAVSLVEAEPPEAVALLREGEVDLALAFDYPEADAAPGGELTVVELMAEELLAVLGPDGPGRRGAGRARRIDLARLADETWIAGCERCRAHLLHLARQAGFEPEIAYATDDYVTVQGLVAAGLGVALLPELALSAARRADVTVVGLTPPAARRIVAVLAAGPRHPPAVTAMLAAVQAAAAARDRS